MDTPLVAELTRHRSHQAETRIEQPGVIDLRDGAVPPRPVSVPEPVDAVGAGDAAEAPALPTRYLRFKYGASRVAAAVALVVLVPVFAATAAAIRWKLGKGVFYRQSRVGRGGKDFVILKFRTMGPDRRVEQIPVVDDRRRTHKSDQDPRHHPLGRLLRKTSIDELPQLWNVMKGEMTLVGPRPELSEVADRYGFRHHPRHALLPGITGAWQVSEHRADPLHEHIEIDTRYVEQVSLRHDLGIVVRSFSLLLVPTGR